MIQVNQKRLHDPENDIKGDCFCATVASLLHLPISAVPNFDGPDWYKNFNGWLSQFGLGYIAYEPDSIQSFRDWNIKGLHHEVAGDSPRFPGTQHACVGVDGDLVFDPHPTKLGLPTIETIGMFISLEPWRHTGHATISGMISRQLRLFPKYSVSKPTELHLTKELLDILNKEMRDLYNEVDSFSFGDKYEKLVIVESNSYGVKVL